MLVPFELIHPKEMLISFVGGRRGDGGGELACEAGVQRGGVERGKLTTVKEKRPVLPLEAVWALDCENDS